MKFEDLKNVPYEAFGDAKDRLVSAKLIPKRSCRNCKHFDTGIFEEPCDSCRWDRKDMREDAPILWEPKED